MATESNLFFNLNKAVNYSQQSDSEKWEKELCEDTGRKVNVITMMKLPANLTLYMCLSQQDLGSLCGPSGQVLPHLHHHQVLQTRPPSFIWLSPLEAILTATLFPPCL